MEGQSQAIGVVTLCDAAVCWCCALRSPGLPRASLTEFPAALQGERAEKHRFPSYILRRLRVPSRRGCRGKLADENMMLLS